MLAILPAAGASLRMRFPKPLLEVGGRRLVDLQVEALAARAGRVVVVLGWAGALVARGLPPGTVARFATGWACEGQSDSVRLALEGEDAQLVLVQPVDVPPPSPEVLDALLAVGDAAVPVWQGTRGHPVLLGPAQVEALRRGSVTGGLRALLGGARPVPVADPRVCWNLNAPRDLARWVRARAAPRGGDGAPRGSG